jgi:hypothetical protein
MPYLTRLKNFIPFTKTKPLNAVATTAEILIETGRPSWSNG